MSAIPFRSRAALALALAWSPLLAATAAEDAAGELQVHLVGCGVATVDDLPALTIASLPKDYWKPAETSRVDHGPVPTWGGIWPEDVILDHVVARESDRGGGPTVPYADRDTVALVSAEGRLRPLDLTRSGARFALRCEAVPALAEAVRPLAYARRELMAISFGRLAPGDYTCDLVIDWRSPDPTGSPLHAFQKATASSLPFTVSPVIGDGHAATTDKPASVSDADLHPPRQSLLPARPAWQVPRSLMKAYGGETPAGLHGVGPIDLAALGKEPVADPIMPNGGAGHQVAIVLGPALNSGEWLRLRSVTQTNGAWTVTIETWRDTGGRDKNVIHRELLAVPIDSPADAPVPPQVTLRWRRLLADQPGGLYHEQPDDGAIQLRVSRDPLPGAARSPTEAPAAAGASRAPATPKDPAAPATKPPGDF